jgi:hypothetical protein
MIAKCEAISAEIERRLLAISLAEEVTSEATGDPSSFPSLNTVEGVMEADNGTEPGATRYTVKISVEGYVEGSAGLEARTSRNALYLEVVRALIDDTYLNGLAEEMAEGTTRRTTAYLSNQERLGFVTEFTVQFVAASANPVA